MESKNSNIRLEINNLIDDAVNNAVARRNLAEDSEDALVTLSNDETANIAGGFANLTSVSFVKVPIICGGRIPILQLQQIDKTSFS
ncbi:MAG: hypothetical protein RMY29_029715 [Nostoc sp. CreGUA01]|nr:hypothetical protein [Nostoc sp. CreGUA01]